MTPPTQPTSGDHATDDELAAYAVQKDRVVPEVAQHIEQCQQCHAVIDQYHLLDAVLFRIECPGIDILQAYVLEAEALDATQRATVDEHTQDCLLCQQDLATIRAVLAGAGAGAVAPAAAAASSPTWEQLREQARRIVAQLLPSQPSLGFALKSDDNGDGEAMGSSQDVEFYAVEDEGLEVALRRTRSLEGITLVGRIVGAEHAISARLFPVKTTTDQTGTEEDTVPLPVAEAAIAAGGSFELGPVAAGQYTLELLIGDRLILIAALVL